MIDLNKLGQYKNVLQGVVKDKIEHKHLNRIKEVKAFAMAVMTGKGQDEYLTSLRSRENESQKEQRIKLTNTATKLAIAPVKKEFAKVENISGQTTVFVLQDEVKRDRIWTLLDEFNGNKSLETFIHEKFLYYTFHDPNAVMLMRPIYTDATKEAADIKDYTSIIIESEQKVAWEKTNGVYDYLIIESQRSVKIDKNYTYRLDANKNPIVNNEILSDYVLFAKGFELELINTKGKTIEELEAKGSYELIKIPMNGDEKTATIWDEYALCTIETKTEDFPCIEFGYIPDPETKGETFITPLYECEELIKDLIRDKSVLDVSTMLHGFPQEIRMTNPCDHKEEYEGIVYECDRGRINNHVCPSCKGTGINRHVSEQSILFLNIEALKDTGIKLDDFIHYATTPIDFLKHISDVVKVHKESIYKAVFHSNLQEEVNAPTAKTATEVDNTAKEKFAVLRPYADKYSYIYVQSLRLAAQYYEAFTDKAEIRHYFPTDFKLKSIGDYYDELQRLQQDKAPFEVIETILHQIIDMQNLDNPKKAAMQKLRLFWKPFKHLTDGEAMAILNERAENDRDRVLYENHSFIFDMIENDTTVSATRKPFYLLEYNEQKARLDEAINEYIKTIQYSQNDIGVNVLDLQNSN